MGNWFSRRHGAGRYSTKNSVKGISKMGKPGRRTGRVRYLLLLITAIPLVGFPLALSDYLNQSSVSSSGDQFETVLGNNEDEVQIILNAELVVVKQVVNDDGGNLVLGDFNVASDAGTLAFDTGTTSGTTTTYTSKTLYVPPGTYSLTETDVPGYTEGAWSCTTGTLGSSTFNAGNVTLAFGEQTVCTIINDDISPILTLSKNLINDDGGANVVGDFDISIDGTEVVNGAPNDVPANQTLLISELDVAGYTEGTWTCTDANGLTPPANLPAGGVATGAKLDLAPGSDVTCVITNDDIAPQLTLAKNLINDNGGALTVGDFDISIDAVEVANGAANVVSANAAITISELDLPGYTEGTWTCDDNTGLTPAADLPTTGLATGSTVTLQPGADVVCKITNDDVGPQLTLAKNLVNDNGGNLTVADFDISIDGTEVLNGASNLVAANAAITISELDVAGYTEGTWECNDVTGLTPAADLPAAGAAGGATVTLAPGADVTCRITNDDVAPVLTLTKTLINDNGGDLTVTDFDLALDGTVVTAGTANTVIANTGIEISELDLPGYTEGTWSCTDATGLTPAADLPSTGLATSAKAVLAPGADVTCSITNNDIGPQLTLAKNLINDDGGNLTVGDFDISIDAVEVANGASNLVAANAAITIAELDLPGYIEGTWSCSDATGLTPAADLPTAGLATGASLTLEPGADVTCKITNNDIGPKLTLAKNLINDDGGNLTVADFDISIDGAEVLNGVTNAVAANTAINISELDVAGYTEGTWECNDATGLTPVADLPTSGAAAGATVTLASGADVTCRITNDDVAPRLTLSKTVLNDDGGDLTVGDFDISVDGVEVLNGVVSTVAANTAIAISELDLPGYVEGTWACTDTAGLTPAADLPASGAATGATATLKPGADVSCVITNDDIAPILTLSKNLINDNGGALVLDDFDISIDGTEVANGASNSVAANALITISELDMPGYTEGQWFCSDASGLTPAADLPTTGAATGADLTLAPGADVTCLIVNDDIGPTLTLAKTVVNDNGGTLAIDDFDIAIDGTEVTSGVANAVLANASILISELDLVPYAEGTWVCTDANGLTPAADLPTAGLATATTLTLQPGSDVTCAITNNDLGIDLSIAKAVDDATPNIGQTITFTLTVLNNGPDVATNATVNDVVPAGFTYVPGSIAGGTSSDDTDPTGTGLDWSLANMPVGTPFTLSFDATVNAP